MENEIMKNEIIEDEKMVRDLFINVPCDVLLKCDDALSEEKWLELSLALSDKEAGPYLEWLFPYYYSMTPDSEKYDLAVRVYTDHGDSYECVRQAVREKRGTPVLPDGQDVFQVYRAGNEYASQAPYMMSWTTDKDVANKFVVMQSMKHDKPSALYEGWIKREDILAYANNREESEVIQYGSVKDVREIPVSEKIVRDMILYDLGLRPCWPKVSAKIGKLGPDPFEGYKEVDNPPLDLVKIRDTLGAGFRIMGGEEGEIIIKYDLGMGWHLNVFPVGDKILVHVGREGHHVYGKIIEQRFFQTEIKWLLKEYSHRKIRRRHREEESSFLL